MSPAVRLFRLWKHALPADGRGFNRLRSRPRRLAGLVGISRADHFRAARLGPNLLRLNARELRIASPAHPAGLATFDLISLG